MGAAMPGTKAPEQARRQQIMQAAYAVAAEAGLEGLTIRRVAAKAGLSGGLVLFHFETREVLILELLEWLLDRTTALAIPPTAASGPPLERLCAIVGAEIRRFSESPERLRLLFEYWVLGMRHRQIQTRMRLDLRRYRDGFVPLARDVIERHPAEFGATTAEGLAAVVVSFIKGYGMQTIIDLDHSDGRELGDAADHLLRALVRGCAPSAQVTGRRSRDRSARSAGGGGSR
jgi:TetR/AcrR family transcriptional regulator, transcriptional repressor of bet genes